MLHIVIGGSGSGKSEFAEMFAEMLGIENKIYVATMFPYDDEETKSRIMKHRKKRAGKGFVTIEQPLRLNEIQVNKDSVVLLECMSNLLANEMFLDEGRIKLCQEKKNHVMAASGEAGLNYDDGLKSCMEDTGETFNCLAHRYIIGPVLDLANHVKELIIVTNEVFSDGNKYDYMTEEYVRLLGCINRKLAENADTVVEVVCGIPVVGKGELPC